MNSVKCLLAVIGLVTTAPAAAAVNLVVNGDFELLSAGPGQLGYNTTAIGWTSAGVNYVFNSATADTTGVTGQFGNFKFWGPGNGIANGLGPSPSGGNYIGAEGAFRVGPISQMIHGLTIGKQYTVSFNWGGAQQRGVNGATTENWAVSLGSDTQVTATIANASRGFTGWQGQSFLFTAHQTSELLSFLAAGTPHGGPPMSLLDSVRLTGHVPEPETWALMIGGLGLIGVAARRRRYRIVAA